MQNNKEITLQLDIKDTSVSKVNNSLVECKGNNDNAGSQNELNTYAYWNYLFNSSMLYLNTVILLSCSSRIRISYKYGFYYYFSWLRVGCMEYSWKHYYTIFFLLEFSFSNSVMSYIFNFSLFNFKYAIVPHRKFFFYDISWPNGKKKKIQRAVFT